jgi:predicted ATPase
MAFYRSFKIANFKNFKEFEIQGFERINLIVGKNNSGKTALLEALFIHAGAYNPELALRIGGFRGIDIINPISAQKAIESLFYNFDTNNVIELSGKTITFEGESFIQVGLGILHDEKKLREISPLPYSKPEFYPFQKPGGELLPIGIATVFQLTYEKTVNDNIEKKEYYLILTSNSISLYPPPPSPPFMTIFIPSREIFSLPMETQQFSQLRLENFHEKIISALKIIEPDLKTVEVLTISGLPILYGDIGLNKPLPLAMLGEGLVRLSRILTSIGVGKNGIVLIDEIENGFHYSITRDVWKAIAKMARECNVQVFATTHSFECIMYAHEAFIEDEQYDFKLFRLENVKGKIVAIDYDKETLDEAIKAGFEVR